MLAALLKGVEKIEIADVPIPQPEPNEVQIKVHAVGICGTDMHIYKGYGFVGEQLPVDLILGHEFSGTITKLGSEVTDFKIGDRVVIEPNIGCGECATCISGAYVLCERGQKIIGIHRHGGFAEYAVVPKEKVFKIPGSIPFSDASIMEPFAITVYGMMRAGFYPGDWVVVLGPGVAGLCFVQLAKAAGASKVILIGPNPARLTVGEKIGADLTINSRNEDPLKKVMELTNGRGVDFVFEAAGVPETVSQMFKYAKPRGRVCIYGVPVELVDGVDFAEFLMKDLVLVAAAGAQNTFPRAIEIVASKKVDLGAMITHKFKLSEIEHGFEVVEKRLDGVAKAIVQVEEEK
ncbi:MAG: alcohol dehydrogenase catalytic domain-containing protein [Actinobacteria bacterium]|nr:alcohol dehydrogenase catalytic domain-containing protein [Actinomycetota bacterium]